MPISTANLCSNNRLSLRLKLLLPFLCCTPTAWRLYHWFDNIILRLQLPAQAPKCQFRTKEKRLYNFKA
jgi:hypothetical protein